MRSIFRKVWPDYIIEQMFLSMAWRVKSKNLHPYDISCSIRPQPYGVPHLDAQNDRLDVLIRPRPYVGTTQHVL